MEAQWQMGKEEKIKDTTRERKGFPRIPSAGPGWQLSPAPQTLPFPMRMQGARTGPVRGNKKLTSVGFAQDFRSP